ncbi:ROK family transcriptional regulator [Reinekea sp.]|uniref:ROK family transcriptional regulator n=1 Tax=Reinekea sp. TaxID=1970455 RepID=UPI002A80E6F5|nr:ROK family transcriptional regulator [Reinekea sp.]
MRLDENQKRVFNEFRPHRKVSKSEVARRVNLTHPAVTQIVKKLCDMGYLQEEKEKSKGPRGQPATLYSISVKNVFVGIHVGRTRLEFVAIELTGNVLTSAAKSVGFLQKEKLKASSQQELDAFLASEQLKGRHIVGVGISTPYFWEGWQSILPPNNTIDRTWNSDIVTSLFDIPDVEDLTIENDGSAAALGELTFGNGSSHKDFLYVNIGTFIGGGLVIDGTLRTGAHGNTAALAPFPVSQSQLPNVQATGRPFGQLLSRASLFSLKEYANSKGLPLDISELDSLESAEINQCLNEWIEDCAGALAQCFIGVWSLIDIEAIVLDGLLPKPVLQRIIDATLSRIQGFQTEGVITCDVKLGELGSMAQSIGAACLPVLSILGPPPINQVANATSKRTTCPI